MRDLVPYDKNIREPVEPDDISRQLKLFCDTNVWLLACAKSQIELKYLDQVLDVI